MSAYKGVIIEESLENKDILKKLKILKTEVKQVTLKHQTPWVKQWTLHTIEISNSQVDKISQELSTMLDSKHNWYADFKTDKIHYIIYRNKIFKVDRTKLNDYAAAKKYGISLGIPEYQVDFTANVI